MERMGLLRGQAPGGCGGGRGGSSRPSGRPGRTSRGAAGTAGAGPGSGRLEAKVAALGLALHDAEPKAPPAALPKAPTDKAVQCYRLKFLRGESLTETAIATQVYGDAKKQYQVSRDLKAVRKWIEAGNVLPDLAGFGAKPRTISMDPSKLEQGPRRPRGRGKG